MKLYAISDLHLGYPENREALLALPPHREDWLIVAGDIGESLDHLHFALSTLAPRFAQLLWVPGNHDLWTLSSEEQALKGEAKYQALVSICRNYGVLTPEDPYAVWPGEGSYVLAPLFLLYDYSFRPDSVPADKAVEWATEAGFLFRDEALLHPDPYPSRTAWCEARCTLTEQLLEAAASPTSPFILINHFPMQAYPLSLAPRPPLSLWSGTRRTEHWHTRFPTTAVIYGHLHMRATYYRDGVRFEEVSLGYPPNWQAAKGVEGYLRTILPGPQGTPPQHADVVWHW